MLLANIPYCHLWNINLLQIIGSVYNQALLTGTTATFLYHKITIAVSLMLYPFLGLEFVFSPRCSFLHWARFSKWVSGFFCKTYIPTLDSYPLLQLSLIYEGSKSCPSILVLLAGCALIANFSDVDHSPIMLSSCSQPQPWLVPIIIAMEHDEIGHRVWFRS